MLDQEIPKPTRIGLIARLHVSGLKIVQAVMDCLYNLQTRVE